MKKKNLGRAVFWLSAFFLIDQCFFTTNIGSFEGERDMLLDKLEESCSFAANKAAIELFPLISYRKEESWMEQMLKKTEDRLIKEVIPAVDYCNNYWENQSKLSVSGDWVPDYFLEADEGKEEKIRDISSESLSQKQGARTYSTKQLKDYSFLINHFYIVDSTTSVTAGELKGDKLAAKDLSISLKGSSPKILIYHTHGSEDFKDSRKGKKEDTVIGAGDELASVLEKKYQIAVYHDRSVYDTIGGILDRSKAYTYAGNGVTKNLKKYPSIQVVIDLHRDAVGGGTRLVTDINGKKTAKIMFFNGMSRTAKNGDIGYLQNPNKEANLAFSLQMQLAAARLYPGFTRKIYLKGYRYNLHLKPRSLLIEAGAQTNTVEEVKNAMEPLADLLYTVLK